MLEEVRKLRLLGKIILKEINLVTHWRLRKMQVVCDRQLIIQELAAPELVPSIVGYSRIPARHHRYSFSIFWITPRWLSSVA